ncbi:unnamed protein product, partial [Pelagomonas calceolata]
WVDRETDHFRSSLHASRLTAKEPITHAHPQACEPRCADVFKHYLACADRIEQKGAGAGAASLNTKPPSYAIAATAPQPRRRLRALLLRLAQVHRQVRDAAHHAEAQVEFFKYY